jgi:hypothetical protein
MPAFIIYEAMGDACSGNSRYSPDQRKRLAPSMQPAGRPSNSRAEVAYAGALLSARLFVIPAMQ